MIIISVPNVSKFLECTTIKYEDIAELKNEHLINFKTSFDEYFPKTSV